MPGNRLKDLPLQQEIGFIPTGLAPYLAEMVLIGCVAMSQVVHRNSVQELRGVIVGLGSPEYADFCIAGIIVTARKINKRFLGHSGKFDEHLVVDIGDRTAPLLPGPLLTEMLLAVAVFRIPISLG